MIVLGAGRWIGDFWFKNKNRTQMDASIFTPDLDKLAKLETLGATTLFRNLLWCDASRLRLRNIFVSENTSTSDGRIDVKPKRQRRFDP